MQHLQFLFCFFISNKGFHNNQKWKYWKVTNDINSILYITVLYFTVQYSKCSNAKIKHKLHYCKCREKQANCAWVGLQILQSVWVWPQDLINVTSDYFLLLSNGENNALCAESIHGLMLPQCLRMPLPLPVEEQMSLFIPTQEVTGSFRWIQRHMFRQRSRVICFISRSSADGGGRGRGRGEWQPFTVFAYCLNTIDTCLDQSNKTWSFCYYTLNTV